MHFPIKVGLKQTVLGQQHRQQQGGPQGAVGQGQHAAATGPSTGPGLAARPAQSVPTVSAPTGPLAASAEIPKLPLQTGGMQPQPVLQSGARPIVQAPVQGPGILAGRPGAPAPQTSAASAAAAKAVQPGAGSAGAWVSAARTAGTPAGGMLSGGPQHGGAPVSQAQATGTQAAQIWQQQLAASQPPHALQGTPVPVPHPPLLLQKTVGGIDCLRQCFCMSQPRRPRSK